MLKVLYVAPFSNFGPKDAGYGNASEGFLKVLRVMQIRGLIDFRAKNTNNILAEDMTDENEYDVCLIVINPHSLLNQNDYNFFKHLTRKCKKVYLNILWETIPLPKSWMPIWNIDFLTGFFASSYFICSQLQNVTTKKVYYCPIFIDPYEYPLCDISCKEREQNFTVLFVGQNTKRKGLEDSITSFCRAFGGAEDTQMVVKGYSLSDVETDIETLIRVTAMSNMDCKKSPIFLLDDNLTKEQMVSLYQSCSVLLFLSRGEGFGIPAVETMLCGIPVIYTNWSAVKEAAQSPINYGVNYTIDEAYNMFQYGYSHGLKYAVPVKLDAIKALKFYYNKWKQNKKEYYNWSRDNRNVILERYSEDKIIKCIQNLLDFSDFFCPENLFDKDLYNFWLEEIKK